MTIHYSKYFVEILVLLSITIIWYLANDLSTPMDVIRVYFIFEAIKVVKFKGSFPSESLFIIKYNCFKF